MKKLFSILCLFLFLYQNTGSILSFWWEEKELEAEIFAKIENNELPLTAYTTLCIPISQLSEIVWVEKNEFRYKGQLYDLVSQNTENKVVTIVAVSDKEEEALIKNYQKEEKNIHHATNAHRRVKFIQLSYVVSQVADLKPIYLIHYQQTKVYESLSLTFVFINPPSPPPQWS